MFNNFQGFGRNYRISAVHPGCVGPVASWGSPKKIQILSELHFRSQSHHPASSYIAVGPGLQFSGGVWIGQGAHAPAIDTTTQ